MSSQAISSVQESLSGLQQIRGGLEIDLEFNIVSQATRKLFPSQVKVVSGGGSGHEPGHAGFVGRGFLTTCICGSIFASPPVQAILRGILLTGPPDSQILLIVTNYTGDRINFALAEKMAKSRFGYKNIKTILVADDFALDDVPEQVGNRGLAGTILVHKTAGAMAAMGMNLTEVHSFCEKVNKNLKTIGFTFECDWKNGLIRSIEIGKGVHGEPGALKLPDQRDFTEILKFLTDKFKQNVSRDTPVLILLNNLGGTAQHLFQLISNQILTELRGFLRIVKIISGSFFTSLGSAGVSVTVLDLTDHEDILKYIEYETEICWDSFKPTGGPSTFITREDAIEMGPSLIADSECGVTMNGKLLRTVLLNVCEKVLQHRRSLNEMDQECGDGDTGETLSRGALSLKDYLTDQFEQLNLYTVFQNISFLLSAKMGGTSGALLGIFFESASEAFKSTDFSSTLWLKLGNEALSEAGRSKRGHRTMLDVLLTAQDTLESGTPNLKLLLSLRDNCKASALATRDMTPKSGRAVYSNDHSTIEVTRKHPDPGAAFVSLVVDSVVETLAGWTEQEIV